MLAEASCGVSAIFLTPGIDEGNVVASESFPFPPMGVDVDYIYEPYIRACVLVKALNEYSVRGSFSEKPQSTVNANTFYIIHPVLKHIALLSAEKGK
jgi:methionyl-tRNA formyltransferase